jgi:acyl-CoA synthetase (AMP-forming)/AMP-acid ligase II
LNILYTIRRADQLFGSSAAILDESGNVSYRDFYRRAKRAASFLLKHAQRGDRAAVLMLNRPEYFDLYYATAISGIAIVPLNIRWNSSDFVFSLNDSGSSILIVDERFVPLVDEIRAQCPAIATLVYAGDGAAPTGFIDYHSGVSDSPELANIREPEPGDLAGLFYTSGTTGGPKAAMLSHGNLYANAMSMLLTDLPASTVYLHAAPMFHAADIASLYLSVLRGTSHAFIKVFDPVEFMKAVEHHKVTSVTLVPTMINMVVSHPKIREFDLSSLTTILYGASPMPLPLLRRTMDLLPGCSFIQAYGMTEMSPVVTMLEPSDHTRQRPVGRFNPILSAGRPAPGIEARVVDDQDNDVPVGTPGEIIARGASRMLGYWKREDANRDVLRGGWMHTGDIGCFDELGYLYIMDRKKDMIKTGSENVYSPEVEAVLVGHPAVLEAAVIGVPDEKWGETIRAIVVIRLDAVATEDELIVYCRDRLTHFKCPTSVVFADSLPKGGTGKVQKNVLRQRYLAVS